jgi:hypothetical protein
MTLSDARSRESRSSLVSRPSVSAELNTLPLSTSRSKGRQQHGYVNNLDFLILVAVGPCRRTDAQVSRQSPSRRLCKRFLSYTAQKMGRKAMQMSPHRGVRTPLEPRSLKAHTSPARRLQVWGSIGTGCYSTKETATKGDGSVSSTTVPTCSNVLLEADVEEVGGERHEQNVQPIHGATQVASMHKRKSHRGKANTRRVPGTNLESMRRETP